MGSCLYPTKKNTYKMNDHEKNEIIRPEGKNQTISNKIKTFVDKKENLKKLEEKDKKSQFPKDKKSPIQFNSILFDIILEAKKALCKIFVSYGNECILGSGFFMKVDDSKKYLVTVNHLIPKQDEPNRIIEFKLHNKKKIQLDLNVRENKFFLEKDITLIEIKDSDNISKDVKFLFYDTNYIYGYKIYKDAYVFSIYNEYNEELSIRTGKIFGIHKFEFEHNISVTAGSSGIPIMLLNKDSKEIPVIGIHCRQNYLTHFNIGTFIGEIFKDDNENKNQKCVILFISSDQIINFPISGNIKDNFRDFEEKLFTQFPALRNKNLFFLANGSIINRNETLENNRIENDTTILINIDDD